MPKWLRKICPVSINRNTYTYRNFVKANSKRNHKRQEIHFINAPGMFHTVTIKHGNCGQHDHSCKCRSWNIFEQRSQKSSCNDYNETRHHTTGWCLNAWLRVYCRSRETTRYWITKLTVRARFRILAIITLKQKTKSNCTVQSPLAPGPGRFYSWTFAQNLSQWLPIRRSP